MPTKGAAAELGTCLAQQAVSASAQFSARGPEITMNEISDGAIMAALGRQMTTAVARQVVAAGNLANIDTPGYRTKEVQFSDAPGFMRPTVYEAVMERVDEQGHVLGFSVLGVSRFKKDHPLEAELMTGT